MPDSPDIIGVVNNLKELHRFSQLTGESPSRNKFQQEVYASFPAIAAHILDREEKLKATENEKIVFARSIALQSLGLVWAEMFPTEVLPSQQLSQIVERVLASLPTT